MEKGGRKKKPGKFEVRQQRYFSEEFRKAKVAEIVNQQITVKEISDLYGVSRSAVYKWLYRYSPHHSRGTNQVIEMESESLRRRTLQERVAELERIVGRKQLQIDYLEKVLNVASEELGYDLKKNYEQAP